MKNTTNDKLSKMSVNMNNMLQQMLSNTTNINNTNNQHNNANAAYVQPHSVNAQKQNSNNLNNWISQTREMLIKTEQRTVTTRIQSWTKIVNDSVKLIAQKLNIADARLPIFTLKDLPSNTYLKYIMEWNGFHRTPPASFNQCLSNGQSWLNARRGPHYALTLFPDILRFAAKHSSNLSRFMYGNNAQHQEMYNNVLMYKCISRLFEARMQTDTTSNKQSYLLCPNAIKVNPNKSQQNTIAQLIAGYANDAQFYAKFDSHQGKAKFFADKFETQMVELKQTLTIKACQNGDKSNSNSPSAPPLPPPPTTNDLNKEQDDNNTEVSSVFSASSTNSKDGETNTEPASLQKMPSLQKANNKNADVHAVNPCKMEKKCDINSTQIVMNNNNINNKNNGGALHQQHNRPNVSTPSSQTNSHSARNMVSNNNGNVYIANAMHQHQSNLNHTNNQINQLLQSMNANINNQSTNNRPINNNNPNKHIMITQMMNNNNITTNQVSQVPMVTFTNQQHKMILHLLNQLISTYNRQQMNIVYLNNRVHQLELALTKQTLKVEAIEAKSSVNNVHKKHKHGHHRHNNNNSRNNTAATNINNTNSSRFVHSAFPGSRTPKAVASNANGNSTQTSPKSVNMQNVDALSAQKILRAHGIELKQLLNLVQHIPQNQMRTGMNPINTQQRQPSTNNNNNNNNNTNNNIIVNGNPNINQIQMRIPVPQSAVNNGAAQNSNNSNHNDNIQGILKILQTLHSTGNNGGGVGVGVGGVGNMNRGNVMRNRAGNSNINMNINASTHQNQRKQMSQMAQIPTLGKQNGNNMNMARTNVAALMVPSLPKMNAPNPNIRAQNNKNQKDGKGKIKKQSPTPPVLGAQKNRKRNNRDKGNKKNSNKVQPPQKKRKVDHNMNMNMNNMNNNNLLGNIMNNPVMLQMLMNQVSGNNSSHSQNQ